MGFRKIPDPLEWGAEGPMIVLGVSTGFWGLPGMRG